MLILTGGFVGGFCGFWAGGVTTLAFCVGSVVLEGGNPPIIIVPLYAVFGTALYACAVRLHWCDWPLLRGPRLAFDSCADHGVYCAIALSLPPFLAEPIVGGIILASTFIVLPIVIAALVAADRLSARLVERQEADA